MPHVATRERLLRTFVVAEERRWRTTCGAATIRASPFWPSTTLLPMPLAMEVGDEKGFSMLILWEIDAQLTIYLCNQSPTRGIVDRAIQPAALPKTGSSLYAPQCSPSCSRQSRLVMRTQMWRPSLSLERRVGDGAPKVGRRERRIWRRDAWRPVVALLCQKPGTVPATRLLYKYKGGQSTASISLPELSTHLQADSVRGSTS